MELRSTEDATKQQKECLDLIVKEFGSDFETREYEFNGSPALVLTNAKSNESDIIISGHIDVVGGADNLFKPTIKENKLFGRGAYDMKGPLASALHAASEAVKSGTSKTIAILITSDEEVSGDGTRHLLSKEGYSARGAVIPDGGNQTHIVTAQKGFAQLALTVKGSSSHASRPWKGENPIVLAAELVQKIADNYPVPESSDDWKTTVTSTKMVSGLNLNQIPETATVYVDIRYTQESDTKKFLEWFNQEYHSVGSVETIAENGMFFVNESDPFVIGFKQTVQKSTGSEPIFLKECGTSDAIFFTEQGIPAVLYRPNGGGEHSDSEWVDIESLGVLYEVLLDYMLGADG